MAIIFPLPSTSPWTDENGQVWVHNGKNWVRQAADPGIEEAPDDGQQYVRQSKLWAINNPDEWYLGPKDTPPYLDNNGSSLQPGHVYFDTVKQTTLVWDGVAWNEFSPIYAVNTLSEFVWDSLTQQDPEDSLTWPDDYGNNPSNWINGKTFITVYIDGERQINEYDSSVVTGDFIVDYVNNTIIFKKTVAQYAKIIIQVGAISSTDTYISYLDNNASGYGFVIDEDNMISDLNTKVPTQQSTKAYIDQMRTVILNEIANTPSGFNRDQTGIVFEYAGTAAPEGALICDASLKLIADYPNLYAKIQDTWATTGGATNPDSLHFRLPPQELNGFGLYSRGKTTDTNIGDYKASQNLRHQHTADHNHNASVSSVSAHPHATSFTTRSIMAGANGRCMASDGGGTPGYNASRTSNSAGAHTHKITLTSTDINTSNEGGLEANPESIVVLKCIWADIPSNTDS